MIIAIVLVVLLVLLVAAYLATNKKHKHSVTSKGVSLPTEASTKVAGLGNPSASDLKATRRTSQPSRVDNRRSNDDNTLMNAALLGGIISTENNHDNHDHPDASDSSRDSSSSDNSPSDSNSDSSGSDGGSSDSGSFDGGSSFDGGGSSFDGGGGGGFDGGGGF